MGPPRATISHTPLESIATHPSHLNTSLDPALHMGYIRTSRGLITRLACGEKDTLTNTVILSTRMLVHATCMSLQHRPSRSRHPPDEGGSPPHMTWHSPQATTHDLAYLQDAAAGATPPFRPRPAPRPPSRTTAVIPTPQLCNQRLSNAPLPFRRAPAPPAADLDPSYAIGASATPPFHFDARRPRPPPTWTPATPSAPQQRTPQ